MKRYTLVLFTGLMAMGATCGHPDMTPEARQAYYADQVSLRVSELQALTIAANEGTPKLIDDATAITIVKFTVQASRVLREVPNGWMAVVKPAYDGLKLALPADVRDRLRTILAALDALIDLTAKAGPPTLATRLEVAYVG